MNSLIDRIVNSMDTDTLIDILGIGIDELADILEPQIRNSAEAFEFLERNNVND